MAERLPGRIMDSVDGVRLGQSLKAKVFRGGVWLGGGSFIEQVIRFGRNMLLARVLAPSAFGTMAIVVSAAAIFHTIAEIGVREALITESPRCGAKVCRGGLVDGVRSRLVDCGKLVCSGATDREILRKS